MALTREESHWIDSIQNRLQTVEAQIKELLRVAPPLAATQKTEER
jgi:hypothetical protein